MDSYGYAILVAGKKRFGGSIHATCMEDAARKASEIHKLDAKFEDAVMRPNDGKIITPSDWYFKGQRAHLCIFAHPTTRFPDTGDTQ